MAGFSFLHLSDLHIGRRFHGFSLLEDQAHLLAQVVTIARERGVSAVLIAGDFFDSTQPSADAVALADRFLSDLVAVCPVLLTAGNHDSPERLQFGSKLLAKSNLHIAGVASDKPLSVVFEDEFGPVTIDLLPFTRAASVRPLFPDDVLDTCESAVKAVLRRSASGDGRRILVAHQFVVNGSQQPIESESEIRYVGGSGEVDCSAFADYTYVALGHLHGPQSIGSDTVRYSGSLMKYSFSEVTHVKGVNLVRLDAKGVESIESIALTPLRDMIELEGTFSELLALGEIWQKEAHEKRTAYLHVKLKDEHWPLDAMNRLRGFFPYIVTLEMSGAEKEINERYEPVLPSHDPLEQFVHFFKEQSGSELSIRQASWLKDVFDDSL